MTNNTTKAPFLPGDTVVIYSRDSGGTEQELSTSQQEKAIADYCKANGLIPTRIFRDEARPGSSVIKRDGFNEMMDYFRHGATEKGLIIWSYSRFSRGINDSQFFRADLRRRGFKIISIDDNIPEGPEAIFFEAALDWHNHRFLDDMSRDVKRGLASLVAQHGCIPGTPPRGFVRTPVEIGRRRDGTPHIAHRWAPDPDLVPIIRLAFEMRAKGHSLADINAATHLYGSLNSYKTFFSNSLYIGRLEYGNQVVEDYCAPIVDQHTWDLVQAQITRYAKRMHLAGDNPHHPRRQASPYLLSGLLYCAECGSPFFGTSTLQRTGKHYARYVCTRAARRRDCPAKNIPTQALDQAVLEALKGYLTQPEKLQEIQDRLLAGYAGRRQELLEQRQAASAHLSSLNRTINQLVATLEKTPDLQPRSIMERLIELEQQSVGAQTQLADLDAQLAAPPPSLTPNQLVEIAHGLDIQLSPSTDQQTLRAVLRGIVHKITVARNGHQIFGKMELLYPPYLTDPPGSVGITQSPLGALPHTHTFNISFSGSLRAWKHRL